MQIDWGKLSNYQRSERGFSQLWPVVYKEMASRWPDIPHLQRCYLYFHNMDNIPTCKVCGNSVKYRNWKYGFCECCCPKCHNILYAKYGSDNNFAKKEIKEKIKITNNIKYGGNTPISSAEVRAKLKKTNNERYGVDYPFQSDLIQKKVTNSFLAKYNATRFSDPQKTRQTCLDRYGADNPSRVQEFKDKRNNTFVELYGTTNLNELDWFMEKCRMTHRDNQIKEKDFLVGYDENGNWICKCPHPECDQCEEKTYIIKPSLWGSRNKHGAEPCTHLLPIQQTLFSTLEIKIRRWLGEMGIEYDTNDRQFGMEMDIYIPSLKLAIEANGSYWHSTQHKTPQYHIEKSLLLRDHGVRCIFIWDDYKDKDIKEFLWAVIKEEDLSPWKQLWFQDIKGWPADFGLVEGRWHEHKCFHGKYECYDAGMIK